MKDDRHIFKSAYLLFIITVIVLSMSSCKKEPTVTWRVDYVTGIEVQDNPVKCWERYHVSCYYEHGLPEGMDSTAVMALFQSYYGTDDIIYACYPYCYDEDWGADMTEDDQITVRANRTSSYKLQHKLGILSYDGECYKIIK